MQLSRMKNMREKMCEIMEGTGRVEREGGPIEEWAGGDECDGSVPAWSLSMPIEGTTRARREGERSEGVPPTPGLPA